MSMDYSRLSRESLIHEIEQLNQSFEKAKMVEKGYQLGVHNLLDEIETPVYWVKSDYSVYWANRFCLETHHNIANQKCYQIFFGFTDVCEGCKLQQVIEDNKISIHRIQKEDSFKEVYQMPVVRGDYIGVLEFQYDAREAFETLRAQQKLLERYKLENAELYHKNQNMSQFIERFSKSLRTPLRALNGYFLLSDKEKDEIYLKTLKDTAEQLYETLNKMIMASKYDERNIVLRKEEFKLLNVISEATDQARLYRPAGPIHLLCAPTIPEVIKGDAMNFKLLLSYLYEIVMHFSENNPIHVSITEISQTRSKINLKFTYSAEQGESVDAGKMLDYFELERKMDYDSIEAYSISLGIHLARQIVEAFGGTIEIASSLDQEIYANVVLGFDKLSPLESQTETPVNNVVNRVLIVDFEKPDIALEVFEEYELYFAQTGDEAIRLYFEKEPDLMLINVSVEQCDGFEVFDEIERRRKTHRPIVSMSKKLIDNERVFMQDYGFDDYIPKPLTSENFKQIVGKYL